MLAKVHRGTAHDGVAAWESMLKAAKLESASKWLIAGALATQEIEPAMNIKAIEPDLNPTRVFSSDKTLACVAQGIGLASCHNHDQKKILVVELDTSSVKTTCSQSSTAEKHVGVQLTPFYDCFLEAMKKRAPMDSCISCRCFMDYACLFDGQKMEHL